MMSDLQRSIRYHSSPSPKKEGLACEIRALSTEDELIESYRLRYDVYDELGYIRRCNASRLEIDEYDALSIPFGAFDPTSGAMIGTLRLVTTEIQPDYESLIASILVDFDDAELTKQALGPWPHPLPSILSHEIEQQIEVFNTERFIVNEMSRTIVHPGYRGMGVSRGLVELGFAYASRGGPVVVVGGCLPEHLPMYAKFGCQKLPHTGLELFESVGQIAHAVICRTDVLPQPTRGHVDALLRSMESSATECTLAIGRGARARYRFVPSRRTRRRTKEW